MLEFFEVRGRRRRMEFFFAYSVVFCIIFLYACVLFLLGREVEFDGFDLEVVFGGEWKLVEEGLGGFLFSFIRK